MLLKVALVMLISLGARELCVDGVAGDPLISSTGAVEATSSDLAGVPMVSPTRRDDDFDDPVDLYGNEVTAAVAQYKLDGRGALYELHSPQTELPQLAPPKS
jgi:hypothetical protein